MRTEKADWTLFTDWILFAEQKTTLIQIINWLPDIQVRSHLSGILHWIDNVQDYAVDVLGMDLETVFPGINEEEIENKSTE